MEQLVSRHSFKVKCRKYLALLNNSKFTVSLSSTGMLIHTFTTFSQISDCPKIIYPGIFYKTLLLINIIKKHYRINHNFLNAVIISIIELKV